MADKVQTAEATENLKPPGEAGSSGAPQPEQQQPKSQDAGKVPSTNVTDDPNVRKLQQAKDQEIARLKQVAEEARRAAVSERQAREQQQREAEQRRLESLDDGDRAAEAMKLLTQEREQRAQAEAAAQAREQMRERAAAALDEANAERAELGLEPLTPGDQRLNFAGNTPDEVIASMQISLRKIAVADARAALANAKQGSEQKVVQALNDAGVTKISQAGAEAKPLEGKAAVAAKFKPRFTALKGKGNDRAYQKLLAEMRAEGISPQDLK